MTADRVLPAWYVAFLRSEQSCIWTRWLKSGFQHVFAFAPDGDRWIVFDNALNLAYVRSISGDEAAALWVHLSKIGATVLLAEINFDEQPKIRPIHSCASVTAAILGIPGILCALTPYRLYRTLLARGATPILGVF